MMIDLFISHASEDKDSVARPLATALRHRGWLVWFDEFELKLGDSLRRSIDQGLAEAKFGLVILSPSFFSKGWPQRELDGLVAREVAGPNTKVVLPVWHRVDHADVLRYSPPLADRLAAITTADGGIDRIVDQIEDVLGSRPVRVGTDLYIRDKSIVSYGRGITSPPSQKPNRQRAKERRRRASERANAAAGEPAQPRILSEELRIGRSDPCWCGSGKKFQRCHGS